jgi:uncharacterized membrane protein YcaP (DUF421 family)
VGQLPIEPPETRRAHSLVNFLDWMNVHLGFGSDPKSLTFFQISVRGLIVFVATLVMIRLGDKRFLSKKTAFDAILGLILASMLARAVNGSSSFWPTLGGGFVLVGLHRLIAHLSRRWHKFGILVKGTSDQVVRDGQIIEAGMRRNDLSEHDLQEDMRLNAQVDELSEIKVAYAERNGQISVVRKNK